MAEDNKIYVRLKDKSTTYYDNEQDASIVSDRIARVRFTASISNAIANNILIEMASDEARPKYKAQQNDLIKKGIIPPLPEKVKPVEDEPETETEGDVEPDGATAGKKVAAKK